MSLGGLSGLASGVDTSSIVDQLINLERQANARLGLRKSAAQARQTGLKDVATKLNALKTAAQDLASAATWQAKQTVATSDANRVGATLIGGAGIGGHTIEVTRMASSAQRGYTFTPPAAAGTFEIAYANDAASKVTIDVKAGATAADVAAAINAKSPAPAYASVLEDPDSGEERLVLSARKTGQDSEFTLTAAALAPGTFDEKAAYERSGDVLDAEYFLDGSTTPKYSQSNVVENAIAGVRLTLKGVTKEPESVTVGPPAIDDAAIKIKVKAFVDAYNAVVTSTRAKISEKGVANPTTTTDAQKGRLFGDAGLQSMLSQLRIRMGEQLAGLTGVDDLSDIGIAVPKAGGTTSQDAKDGKLALDEAKLAEKLAADSGKVRDLFSAFGAGLDSFIKAQTGTSGVFEQRDKAAESEIKRISDQVTRAEERITAKEKRLKAQFAAMESALLNSQTQSAWLTGQLSSLSG